MLTGLDKDEKLVFTSKSDTGEPKTVFLIRNIPNRTKLQLFKGVTGEKEIQELLTSKVYDLMKAGLAGIENFVNKKTGVAENVTDITDDVLDSLPVSVLSEVVGAIAQFNFVSEKTEKN